MRERLEVIKYIEQRFRGSNDGSVMRERENEFLDGERILVGQVGDYASERLNLICNKVLPNVNIAYHGVLRGIFKEYADVIAIGDEPPGRIASHPFKIDTEGKGPIRSRPYKLPFAKEKIAKGEVDKLLHEGIIKPSSSSWASPIVLVKKKDGTTRLCVDYRKLNAITKDDLFPLPAIEELLVKVRETKFFSTLDLKAGYHQIPVEEGDKDKTAFVVGDGLYEYSYLPFGLKNAPAHFSRVMMSVLAGLIGTVVLVYLDDLIVLGKTFEEHVGNLLKILDTFRRHGIKLKIEKCKFFQDEVEFLGHRVTREGLRPCVDKVAAVKDFPTPKNAKEVASFLGLCGYYRKFIKGFGGIAKPLNVLRSSNRFIWGEEETAAFNKLKEALTGEEVLTYPNFDKPFMVTTDASQFALGGVITQEDDQGRERPICFASRNLHKAELNYSVLEKEALAIVWMLDRHRYLLLGHEVVIRSDHRPLQDLFNKDCKNARQFRWIERLLEFNITGFEYIQGKENLVADCLSRRREECFVITRGQLKKQYGSRNSRTNDVTDGESMEVDAEVGGGPQGECPGDSQVIDVGWDETELISAQKEDEWILKVRNYVIGRSDDFPRGIKMPRDNFVLEGDLLYIKEVIDEDRTRHRLVLPKGFVNRALNGVHSSPLAGHLGINRTLKRARDNFFWLGMKQDVRKFVGSCHKCMCFKSHRLREPEARKWPVPPRKFHMVHMDVVGPFPVESGGHKYVCVFVCALTRFTYLHAMLDKTATSVANALQAFVCRYGCPKVLISDNGLEFVNKVVKELN